MNLIENMDIYKDDMIRDLKRILKYNSVAGIPEGEAYNGRAVDDCLAEALSISKELGFETGRVGGYAGYASIGEGEPYVAVLGHLDIVPAGDGWNHDPFSGETDDGKIYGRGTSDDKGPVMAALYGLKAIADSGKTPGSKILVIFGTSEETGGPDVEKFVEKFGHPKAGFTPDADFPVINAEKSIIRAVVTKRIVPENIEIVELKGGNAPNMVPDKATLVYKIGDETQELVLKGKTAHGSTPEKGENAALKIIRAMTAIDPSLKEDMDFLNEGLEDTTGAKLGIGFEDEESGKLSINLGLIKIENNLLTLTLDLRVPVTVKREEVEGPLRETFRAKGFNTEFESYTPPLFYPKDEPLVKTLMDVYKNITGDTESEPIAIGGGTYAKAMNNVVAFGANFPGRDEVAHIADEYIHIEDLMKASLIFANAMYKLSNI